MRETRITVVIPALNEAENLSRVLDELERYGLTRVIVALDPANTDETPALLATRGVPYTVAARRGFDPSLAAAVAAIPAHYPDTQIVFFADAGMKYAYDPTPFLARMARGADLVLGARVASRTHLRLHQRLGTEALLIPIRLIFGRALQDVSPFRMIRYGLLKRLDMRGRTYRWPSEMLVKCLAAGAMVEEVAIASRARVGSSKVSGSLVNSLKAGIDMFSALRFARFRLD